MIRPLRNRHRRMIPFLAIMTPLLFTLAILARKPIPVDKQITSPQKMTGQSVFTQSYAQDGVKIDAAVYLNTEAIFELQAKSYLQYPDILAYWQNSATGGDNKLPNNAYLLGSFGGLKQHHYTLPLSALSPETGAILLYSLAHQKLIAKIDVPALVTKPTEDVQ